MTNLFYTGGPVFMGILTIVLTAIIATAILALINLKKDSSYQNKLVLIKELSIIGLVIGILGQFLGLYSAFTVIEQAAEISPEILASGLKVSSTPTIYGLIICGTGYLIQIGLRLIAQNKE